MAGRARGIGTHGQRPAEKAGNRGASNYCFGWFHVLILFVCDWCLVALRAWITLGKTIKQHHLPFYARRLLFKRQKGCSFIPESRATPAYLKVSWLNRLAWAVPLEQIIYGTLADRFAGFFFGGSSSSE